MLGIPVAKPSLIGPVATQLSYWLLKSPKKYWQASGKPEHTALESIGKLLRKN